jgi:hypothetical protein
MQHIAQNSRTCKLFQGELVVPTAKLNKYLFHNVLLNQQLA